MKTRPGHAISFAIVALISSAAVFADTGYRYVVTGVKVVDLGTLGGTNSWARDINDSGNIVGESDTASGRRGAFYLRPERPMMDVGAAVPNSWSAANAINNSNVVVGSYSVGTSIVEHAFRWTQAGGLVTLADGSSPGAPISAVAYGISPSGLIVGTRAEGPGEMATAWSDDFTWFGLAGSMTGRSRANAVNDAGVVAGAQDFRMRIWQVYPPFSMIVDLPLPSYCDGRSHGSSSMKSVNRYGVVVGYANCEDITHAILWNGVDALPTDLGVYPGVNFTEAADINDGGFIAGHSSNGDGGYGFIYQRDFGFFQLPALPILSRDYCEASALNNLGKVGIVQVVGWCQLRPGIEHAVRWDVTIGTVPR